MREEQVRGPICFGFVAFAERCSAAGCGQPARAALPLNTREEGPGALWLCRQHADACVAVGAAVEALPRTCGVAVGAIPCGATATHLAIVGVPGRQGVSGVSVCPTHGPGATTQEEASR